MRVSSFILAVVAIVHAAAVVTSSQPEVGKIHSTETIATKGPYSFPEKLALDRFSNLYLLDSQLSNIFVVQRQRAGQQIKALCSPRTPVTAADLSVDRSGSIWILDSRGSQIIKLDRNCKVEKSLTPQRPGLAVEVNSAGELIVLTSTGSALFDLYDQSGNLLRSFGRRISYGDPISDGELNNGHIVTDRSGGFYFSFNYPPLVQRYRRDGKLVGEFKPPSDVHIGPANVSSQKQGNFLAVRANYQILVLDMTLDARGRLILLLSGKPKYQAIAQGSQTLLVVNGTGRVLRKLTIEDAAFHRLVAGSTALYLLRNRDGLRLDRYQLP
jgi:hypothetical protein